MCCDITVRAVELSFYFCFNAPAVLPKCLYVKLGHEEVEGAAGTAYFGHECKSFGPDNNMKMLIIQRFSLYS